MSLRWPPSLAPRRLKHLQDRPLLREADGCTVVLSPRRPMPPPVLPETTLTVGLEPGASASFGPALQAMAWVDEDLTGRLRCGLRGCARAAKQSSG